MESKERLEQKQEVRVNADKVLAFIKERVSTSRWKVMGHHYTNLTFKEIGSFTGVPEKKVDYLIEKLIKGNKIEKTRFGLGDQTGTWYRVVED